jgi:hypothetical protein
MPSMPNYFAGKGSQFGLLDRQFGGEESEYNGRVRRRARAH